MNIMPNEEAQPGNIDHSTIHLSSSLPPGVADEAEGLHGSPVLSESINRHRDPTTGQEWDVEVILYDKSSDVELSTRERADDQLNSPAAAIYTKDEVKQLGEGDMGKGLVRLGLFGYKGPLLKAGSPRPSPEEIAKVLNLSEVNS